MNVQAQCEEAWQQLAALRQQMAEQMLKDQQLEHDLASQRRHAGELERSHAALKTAFHAAQQQHAHEMAQLCRTQQSQVHGLQLQLQQAKQNSEVLSKNLREERKRFEASLLSSTDANRAVPWKEKLQALRYQLEMVTKERDILLSRK